MKKWVADQKLFIALSQEKINLSVREEIMKFLNQNSSQHDVANKSRLYDKEFLQLLYLISEKQIS